MRGLCRDDLRFFFQGLLFLWDSIHVSHHDFLRARERRNRLHIKLYLEFIRNLALNYELILAYLHYVCRDLSRNTLEIGRNNEISCFCMTTSFHHSLLTKIRLKNNLYDLSNNRIIQLNNYDLFFI